MEFSSSALLSKPPRYYPLFVVGCGGLLASVLAFSALRKLEDQHIERSIECEESHSPIALQSAIIAHLEALRSLRLLYYSSEQVTAEEFDTFTDALMRRHKGYIAMRWLPRTGPAGAEGYCRAAATQPVEPCLAGPDPTANPFLRAAMNKARDEADIFASLPTPLYDRCGRLGLFVFEPVYEGGAVPPTVEGRREKLKGLLVGMLDIQRLVREALRDLGGHEVHSYLVGKTATGYAQCLYDSVSCSALSGPVDPQILAIADQPHSVFELDAAGQRWLLVCAPTPAYLASQQTWGPYGVLACGLLVTTLLTGYLWTLIRQPEKVQRLVQQRTAELSEANARLEKGIAQRRRAERELELTQFAVDHSGDSVFRVGPDGRFTYVNDTAVRQLGYSRQELLCMRVADIDPLFPQETWPQHWQRVKQSGSLTFESVHVSKDGRRIPVEITANHVEFDGEEHHFAFVRDITEHKRAREEQEHVMKILADTNQALDDANIELQKQNQELQDFAYVASHDLQEPLRKIEAFGDRLVSKCGGQLDEQAVDYLQRMHDAAVRMKQLINGLLAYSRVTTNAQPFEPTDLNRVVEGVLSDMEVRVEQSQATVEADPLPTIEADPLQMRQLLQNLICNALKFHSPDRKPVVKIRGELLEQPPAGQAGGILTGPLCRLCVEDNGIGFDPKYADRIFGVFQRLHTRREYDGAGVGLAICRRIVERHGGTIAVEAAEGQGARFTILLPARQDKRRICDEQEQQAHYDPDGR